MDSTRHVEAMPDTSGQLFLQHPPLPLPPRLGERKEKRIRSTSKNKQAATHPHTIILICCRPFHRHSSSSQIPPLSPLPSAQWAVPGRRHFWPMCWCNIYGSTLPNGYAKMNRGKHYCSPRVVKGPLTTATTTKPRQ